MSYVRKVKGKYQYFDRAGNPLGKPQKTRMDAERMADKYRAHSVVTKPKKK